MLSTAELEGLFPHQRATVGHLHGQAVVLRFGDWTAEYNALKRAAGLGFLGPRSQWELTGKDRAAFVNRLATQQVDRLGPGEGCETFLTDVKGHIVAHLLVFAGRESLVLSTVAGQAEKIFAHLDHYLIRDGVQFHNRSRQWWELLLVGPRAAELLRQTFSTEPPLDRLAHAEVPWANGSVSLRSFQQAPRAAWILSVDRRTMADLWQALCQAGAEPCGEEALEAFRIELGWPEYGRDVSQANLPQEIGRDRLAISLTKGCYLGQETVARLDSHGHVNKILAGLRFDTPEVPPAGSELQAEGRPAGQVTSAAYSPDLGAAIALGYVRRGLEQPGTRLDSSHGSAVVVALPMD
jgi:folate-binding protein YgfZ